MSDTPRTDNEQWDARDWDDPPADMVVSADFARELEREIYSLVTSLEHVQHERDIWREKNEQVTKAFNRIQQHFQNIGGSVEEIRTELNSVD
jgi:hypothetical protein